MKKLLLLTIVALVSLSAKGYEGSPSEQVSQFFTELKAGENSKAIDNLYSSNPLMSQKPQQLTLLKQQLGVIEPLLGSFFGSENIHTEQLSPSLIRIVQLAKHESHPVIWEFYFYRAKDKWVISHGVFNDQFQFIEAKTGM